MHLSEVSYGNELGSSIAYLFFLFFLKCGCRFAIALIMLN